jgi:hypothetical protein
MDNGTMASHRQSRAGLRQGRLEGRLWNLLATCSIVFLLLLVWFVVYEPGRRYARFYHETRADLQELARSRPSGLTPKQWNNVVGWTITGHANTLGTTRHISRSDMDHFRTNLSHRLKRPVDLATIDWIWDEFERLSPHTGPEYARKYRPTSPEKLNEFEDGIFVWAGIQVE